MISLVNAVELAYWQETTVKVVVILMVIPAGALILGYVFLMKMMSFMQSRLGPMEAGPYGTLQLIADGLKFLQKEDIFPEKADRWLFALAPVVVLISTFGAFGSWQMVAWRLGLTILIASAVGLIVGSAPRRELVLAPGVTEEEEDEHAACAHDDHGHDHGAQPGEGVWSMARRVLGHANGELFEMSRYLIIGALLAATLQTVVPQQPLLALDPEDAYTRRPGACRP